MRGVRDRDGIAACGCVRADRRASRCEYRDTCSRRRVVRRFAGQRPAQVSSEVNEPLLRGPRWHTTCVCRALAGVFL